MGSFPLRSGLLHAEGLLFERRYSAGLPIRSRTARYTERIGIAVLRDRTRPGRTRTRVQASPCQRARTARQYAAAEQAARLVPLHRPTVPRAACTAGGQAEACFPGRERKRPAARRSTKRERTRQTSERERTGKRVGRRLTICVVFRQPTHDEPDGRGPADRDRTPARKERVRKTTSGRSPEARMPGAIANVGLYAILL